MLIVITLLAVAWLKADTKAGKPIASWPEWWAVLCFDLAGILASIMLIVLVMMLAGLV